jgi:hypothetical protein
MRENVHVLRTPMTEYSRTPMGERWCFRCRKRRNFSWVVLVPTDSPSYYSPTAHMVCETCREKDTDLFPGWERTFDEGVTE